MKGKLLAGLVAATFFGGSALAHGGGVHLQSTQDAQSSGVGGSGVQQASPQEVNGLQQSDVAPPPVDPSLQGDQGVGGSGDVKDMDQGQEGIGGSGMVNAPVPPPAPPAPNGVQAQPCPTSPATGGSGLAAPVTPPPPPSSAPIAAPPSDSALEPSLQRDYDTTPVPSNDNEAFVAPKKKMSRYDWKMRNADEGQKKGDMRGLTLLVGAGVEGYTGGLAPEVNPGAAVGVTAAIKPTKVLGIELGYSGAVNNLATAVGGSGPDIIRNGGQAALTLGLTASPIQPYVMGGFGLSYYNVRHGEELGFHSDTNRTIPVGVGLRTHIKDFTADARVNYNVLLDNGFAGDVTSNLWTGRYTGTLNLGGTF